MCLPNMIKEIRQMPEGCHNQRPQCYRYNIEQQFDRESCLATLGKRCVVSFRLPSLWFVLATEIVDSDTLCRKC